MIPKQLSSKSHNVFYRYIVDNYSDLTPHQQVIVKDALENHSMDFSELSLKETVELIARFIREPILANKIIPILSAFDDQKLADLVKQDRYGNTIQKFLSQKQIESIKNIYLQSKDSLTNLELCSLDYMGFIDLSIFDDKRLFEFIKEFPYCTKRSFPSDKEKIINEFFLSEFESLSTRDIIALTHYEFVNFNSLDLSMKIKIVKKCGLQAIKTPHIATDFEIFMNALPEEIKIACVEHDFKCFKQFPNPSEVLKKVEKEARKNFKLARKEKVEANLDEIVEEHPILGKNVATHIQQMNGTEFYAEPAEPGLFYSINEGNGKKEGWYARACPRGNVPGCNGLQPAPRRVIKFTASKEEAYLAIIKYKMRAKYFTPHQKILVKKMLETK